MSRFSPTKPREYKIEPGRRLRARQVEEGTGLWYLPGVLAFFDFTGEEFDGCRLPDGLEDGFLATLCHVAEKTTTQVKTVRGSTVWVSLLSYCEFQAIPTDDPNTYEICPPLLLQAGESEVLE